MVGDPVQQCAGQPYLKIKNVLDALAGGPLRLGGSRLYRAR